ncbi:MULTISPECIES: hypothetical protein [Nonomuraea]|uniref:Cytochrome bc1 complex cytochrome b subunit n=1 Tax=Nonomuraea ferruginea TaxID=46174 RepID=A0ABT4SV61_9ACTN|nr:hypothetical protein [Nonomuraea ferruginea]MDA0641162.1 hypothetical protein [Nonomuraea ferruginea]
MERAGQLIGDTLIFIFLFAVVTGAFLAYHFTPGDHTIVYDGSYAPLQGVPMSEAYSSSLRISFDVPGGLLLRQVHLQSWPVLAFGTFVWLLVARHRYALAAFGLAMAATLSGYATVDDLLSRTLLGEVSTIWWYGVHLVVALALIVVLVISSRREAARQPRTVPFIALAFAIALLAVYWL